MGYAKDLRKKIKGKKRPCCWRPEIGLSKHQLRIRLFRHQERVSIMNKHNPIFTLSTDETAQLKKMLSELRNLLDQQKFNFVWVKLCARQARLSKKQIWMISSTLANSLEAVTIPDFLYGYLEQSCVNHDLST